MPPRCEFRMKVNSEEFTATFNARNKIKNSSPSWKTAAYITSYEWIRLNGAALESIMSFRKEIKFACAVLFISSISRVTFIYMWSKGVHACSIHVIGMIFFTLVKRVVQQEDGNVISKRRAQQKCREKTGSKTPSRCVEKWLSSRFNEPSTLYLFLNILTLVLSDHYQPWIFGFIDHLKDNQIILFESETTSTNRG